MLFCLSFVCSCCLFFMCFIISTIISIIAGLSIGFMIVIVRMGMGMGMGIGRHRFIIIGLILVFCCCLRWIRTGCVIGCIFWIFLWFVLGRCFIILVLIPVSIVRMCLRCIFILACSFISSIYQFFRQR